MDDAIVIEQVSKRFRKYATRKDARTFKSELIRVAMRRKAPVTPATHVTALEEISLRIPRGKTVGLVGRNGSGKSTLLKLITGIYKPTTGRITVQGRISALLELGAGFHPDFTGRENILINGVILGMARAEIRARMEEIIAFSELGEYIDAPVRTYSSGMYMRLAFSVATHVNPDILIVDEILAVGDEHFSRKSLAKMTEFKRSGKTILLVTHDLGTLQNWCDHAAWIDSGRIRHFGDPREVVDAYRSAVAKQEAHDDAVAAPARLDSALPAASETVKITEVTLSHPAHQDELGVLKPEDGLTVNIGYQAAGAAARAAELVCELRRSDGPLVYAASSGFEAVPLEAGSHRVALTFDPLMLLDGEYVVDVVARSKEGLRYDAMRGARFRISASLGEAGLVRLPHRWEHSPR